MPGGEETHHFEYSWGPRAKAEIKHSDILKFVARVYEKNVSEFRDQFEQIKEEEGEDIFNDIENDPDGDAAEEVEAQ